MCVGPATEPVGVAVSYCQQSIDWQPVAVNTSTTNKGLNAIRRVSAVKPS